MCHQKMTKVKPMMIPNRKIQLPVNKAEMKLLIDALYGVDYGED